MTDPTPPVVVQVGAAPEPVEDLRYVSRYATESLGFTAYVNGAPTDVDGEVTAYLIDTTTQAMLFSRTADRVSTGVYGVTLTGADTAVPGVYSLNFSYQVSGADDLFVLGIEIGQTAPAYDSLTPELKAIVEQAWIRFADSFDSQYGGPWLRQHIQSHFGRNRIAQLMRNAVSRLNTIAQPYQSYTVDDPANLFPLAKWGGLLEFATYIEIIKHLIRSYTEQPEALINAGVSRLDRRDYMPRWQNVLAMEQRDLDQMLETFKIDAMGLGSATGVLVAGGVYGRWFTGWGGSLGEAAARGYYPGRYY